MKRSVLVVLVLCLWCNAFSQHKPYYKGAIGIRAGSEMATCGITFKYFLSNQGALEFVAGYANKGFCGTLLFEQHVQLFGRKELQAYFGGGVHYTQKSGYGNYREISSRSVIFENGGAAYGLDGVLGLSYKFLSIPLAVSFDLKPFGERNNFGNYHFAIDKSIGLKLTF